MREVAGTELVLGAAPYPAMVGSGLDSLHEYVRLFDARLSEEAAFRYRHFTGEAPLAPSQGTSAMARQRLSDASAVRRRRRVADFSAGSWGTRHAMIGAAGGEGAEHSRGETKEPEDTGSGQPADGQDVQETDGGGRQTPGKGSSGSGNDEDDDEDDDEEEEEDDGVVRCVCGERNDGELMIQCEMCQVWQHTLCMGIRDEAHIPDKYYCERCRPEDHPYINSRARSLVLAETTNVIGSTSSMMRRSAVMAVAKMTAREEYRSAVAAATIAASVASADTKSPKGKGKRSAPKGTAAGKRTNDKPARKGGKARRYGREESEDGQGNSTDNDEDKDNGGGGRSTNGSDGGGGMGARPKGKARRRGAMNGSARNGQTPKRRRVADVSGADSKDGVELKDDEGEFAEDLVARMMGAKPEPTAPGASRGRGKKPRNRSSSSAVKPAGARSHSGDRAGDEEQEGEPVSDRVRRGRSMPGSPSSSRSPSPSLQSLLYGSASTAAPGGSSGGRLPKRKRNNSSAASRSIKHQRMTVSATNSPLFGGDVTFGSLAEENEEDEGSSAPPKGAKGNGSGKGKAAAAASGDDDDDDEGDGDDERPSHSRQPRHNFPPLEIDDIDGNKVTVPSSMLNSQGQPMYSSTSPDTMCKVRYPHSKSSLYELNRRAKQLLEWLGKTQSEYEHERRNWLTPPPIKKVSASNSTSRLSEAPTSPIHPSDWPGDENGDGASNDDQHTPRPQRSTLSIVEDLTWRLIRFQETYSS
ncbi:Histone deacetylase complex subunit [Coemansia sp. RSA 552]|nr:Histone deacetylase complex subunit [Coemansia sp. RSA 552]